MHSIGRTIAANPACESYESISLFSIQALFAVPPPFFFWPTGCVGKRNDREGELNEEQLSIGFSTFPPFKCLLRSKFDDTLLLDLYNILESKTLQRG